MDVASPLELLVIVGVLVGAALLRARGPVDQDRVLAWAEAHEVDVTPASRPAVLGFMTLPLMDWGPGADVPSWGLVAALGAIVVGFAAGVERLERWIVHRPQPFVSEPSLAADDAIRAQSVHSVAGACVGFLLFAGGLAGTGIAASDRDLGGETMWPPAAVAVLAFLVCRYYGDRAWRVRSVARASGRSASA